LDDEVDSALEDEAGSASAYQLQRCTSGSGAEGVDQSKACERNVVAKAKAKAKDTLSEHDDTLSEHTDNLSEHTSRIAAAAPPLGAPLMHQTLNDTASCTHAPGLRRSERESESESKREREREPAVLRKVVEESVVCLSQFAHTLHSLPQHLDALLAIASRCTPRITPPDEELTHKTPDKQLQHPQLEQTDLRLGHAWISRAFKAEWILRAFKAVVTLQGVRVANGKTLPRQVISLLLTFAAISSPSAPCSAACGAKKKGGGGELAGSSARRVRELAARGARVRELAAQVLAHLLCAWQKQAKCRQLPLLQL
jgi:hypothetical protein